MPGTVREGMENWHKANKGRAMTTSSSAIGSESVETPEEIGVRKLGNQTWIVSICICDCFE